MSSLIVNNTIPVDTSHGKCAIELCLGSVTKVQDKVDVLVVSAFPGDYTPTAASVIGALQRDLNISVKKLARDKEEDLRKFFSCWWSKPLPKKSPFKRILCFEGGFKRNVLPPSTVGEVFRSLVSLCKQNDISVMMTLVATGDQSYNKRLMLRLVVDAAIHWMKIGLPLKVLKIVLYANDPTNPGTHISQLTDMFEELKKRWLTSFENIYQQELVFKYDVYLSSCLPDNTTLQLVLHFLQKHYPNIRIFDGQHQEVDKDKVWQEHIYEAMVTCAKVVVILTPKFLDNKSCIEQFNIALCCSRQKSRDYLAPLYVEDIQQLPTYMGLIQYLDCRSINEELINGACQTISSCLLEETKKVQKQDSRVENDQARTFDIFISYSHKDMQIANLIKDFIQKCRLDWKIFVDQTGLTLGASWQSTLYKSIENSRSVLSLLSTNYMDSKVCQEEYNLARALHEDPHYKTNLVEVMISDVDDWPAWCPPKAVIDFTSERLYKQAIEEIIKLLDNNKCVDSWEHTDYHKETSIKDITSSWRQVFLKTNMPLIDGLDFLDVKHILNSCAQLSNVKYDVVLSYHENDSHSATVLSNRLLKLLPTIRIESTKNHKSTHLHVIDEGRLIVPLLSQHYITEPELMEEFNTALCRHRFSSELILMPIIVDALPIKPVYPQITLCFFSVLDTNWLIFADPMSVCMKEAAKFIGNVLVRNPKVTSSFKTLVSMKELQQWTYQKTNKERIDSALSPICFLARTSTNNVTVADVSHQNPQNTEAESSEANVTEQKLVKKRPKIPVRNQSVNVPSTHGLMVTKGNKKRPSQVCNVS